MSQPLGVRVSGSLSQKNRLVFIPSVCYNDNMMDKDKRVGNQRRWRRKNPNYHNEWRAKNKDSWNAYVKQWRQGIRLSVLTHYSRGSPHCACCGESHIEFLCIDHINGGGTKHLKGIGGGLICEWLRKNDYPLGYRVLCHNCNQSLGLYGHCPHGRLKE